MTAQLDKLTAITEHLATIVMEMEGDTYIMMPNPTLASDTITWLETVKLFTYDKQDIKEVAYRTLVDRDCEKPSNIIAYQPTAGCIAKLVNMSIGEITIVINIGKQQCDSPSATMSIVAQRLSKLSWRRILEVRRDVI